MFKQDEIRVRYEELIDKTAKKSIITAQERMELLTKIANEEILPIKKPDIDNLAKSILDALNGIAYLDDSQIVLLSIQKTYSDTPKAVVSITEF